MIELVQNLMRQVRRLNFISALNGAINNDLTELNKFIMHTVEDEPFIKEACLPLISGGKRLRPILFFICTMTGGNENVDKKIPLAAAIELIHTASLVHDDILDNSKMRRGIATANSRYGAQIAVLIGDYLFAKAFQIVSEGHYGDEVSAVLSKLVKNLCIGEITQDSSLFKVPTLTEYHKRIYLKTAVFLSSCCQLGGLVNNLQDNDIDSLANYGTGLGLAFQIVDDLLDFFGDTKVTGKQLGGDLKSGVITLPVLRALQVSSDSKQLYEMVTKGNLSDDEIISAIDIIKRTDAAEYCKNRAAAYIESARINLPSTINTITGLALEQLADFVIERNW